MEKDLFVSWIFQSPAPMLLLPRASICLTMKNKTEENSCYNSDNISTFILTDLQYLNCFKLFWTCMPITSIKCIEFLQYIHISIKHTHTQRALIWCITQYCSISISYPKVTVYITIKLSNNKLLIACHLEIEQYSILQLSGTFSMLWRRLTIKSYN